MAYSSTENARAYLQTLITNYKNNGQTRLPPARKLAAEAGVAESTMLKAVRQLKEEGVVSVSHGRGTHIVTHTSPLPAKTAIPESTQPRWQAVAAKIYQRLIQHQWKVLPSAKELRNELGTGYVTLKRALHHLQSDGIIEPFKKSYRVTTPQQTQSHSALVLISRGITWGEASLESDMMQELVKFVQYYTSQNNVRLIAVPCHYQPDGLHGLHELKKVYRSINILGTILIAEGIDRSYLSDILLEIRAINRPVAILDRSFYAEFHKQTHTRFTRIYTPTDNPRCGSEIARLLLQLGHRRVVYLDDGRNNSWSHLRYTALLDEFRRSGYSDAVEYQSPQEIISPTGAITQALQTVYPQLQTACNSLSDSGDMYNQIGYKFGRAFTELGQSQLRTKLYSTLQPVLDTIVARPEITALVGSNDTTALIALHYLQSRNIPVPQRMSLVGFDNTYESFISRLTTYDFGYTAIFRDMVNFTLHSDYAVKYSAGSDYGSGFGTIVERNTTAPPHTAK